MDSISDKMVMLVPTFHKRHIYMQEIGKIVDAYVTGSLRKIILTDKELSIHGYDTLISTKPTWAEILLDGLLQIGGKFDYVFLMLEDLVPFSKIKAGLLKDHLELMEKHNFKNITFRTYEFDDLKYEFVVDGLRFHKISSEFSYYCQLQPTIWNRIYLTDILTDMISQGIASAWEFEFYKSKELHLVSEYRWPNVLGGFIEGGSVNKKAIEAMEDNAILKQLKVILWKKYLIEQPKILLKKIERKLKGLDK